MEYCMANLSVSQVWVNYGFSPCFIQTFFSCFLLGEILLLGSIQLYAYTKYSEYVEKDERPKKLGYRQQIVMTIVVIAREFVSLISAAVTGHLYGYLILSSTFFVATFLLSLGLLYLERTRVVRSTGHSNSKRGHGIALLILWTVNLLTYLVPLISFSCPFYFWKLENKTQILSLVSWVVSCISSIILFIHGLRAPGLPQKSRYYSLHINSDENDPESAKRLLEPGEGSGDKRQASASEGSAWSGFWTKLKMMWPFMWPKGHPLLQIRIVICFLILAANRGINVLVPLYYKKIVDQLSYDAPSDPQNQPTQAPQQLMFPWKNILVYVLLKFLQGGLGVGSIGFLNNIRSFLWIRVQQYTNKAIQVHVFTHLHGLSLRWHLGRKTGEVLRVMDRGTASLNSLLSYVVFSIAPTIVDITIAIIYFATAFNIYFGVIVLIAMILYLIATIGITEWRTKYRRQMNLLDNETRTKAVDSLLNFETVKYYGNEDFEVHRFEEAINNYQNTEWESLASLNILNTAQNIIITLGLLAGSLLCAHMVTNGPFTVGDYVLFGTYIIQLYGPLNFFGTYYRMIQQAFIDMENMIDLLSANQEVKDIEEAQELTVKEGAVEFDNVCFHYNVNKPILRNVSFKVAPGRTLALVGPSGSGKSTIIRLLFRFYDIQSGCIRIDGEDISKVTQSSLRQAIGVVPQDTVLFNNDIKYNLRYGRSTASDAEMNEAARAAEIHNRILSFPDGYETTVGERGLKLSGGEKQRVAIARTILKAPQLVLLDEATSALDTQTERNIQASLALVCANRTTVIVAHRLSTIIHADEIAVLREGVIIERGRHEELLARNGTYTDMWLQQQRRAEDVDNPNLQQINENEEKKDL